MPIGLAVASPVAEALGVNVWFAISGIAIVALGVGALARERKLDGDAQKSTTKSH